VSLGRSGPGVRSGSLITPRTRFGGVFLASASTASQLAVSRHARVASGDFASRCSSLPSRDCHPRARLSRHRAACQRSRPRRRDGRPERVIRREDTIGHVYVQVHVVVERGAEAVQEGDAAEPRAALGMSVAGVPPAATSRRRSISVRKIFVIAATARGRSASMPRNRLSTAQASTSARTAAVSPRSRGAAERRRRSTLSARLATGPRRRQRTGTYRGKTECAQLRAA